MDQSQPDSTTVFEQGLNIRHVVEYTLWQFFGNDRYLSPDNPRDISEMGPFLLVVEVANYVREFLETFASKRLPVIQAPPSLVGYRVVKVLGEHTGDFEEELVVGIIEAHLEHGSTVNLRHEARLALNKAIRLVAAA
jgi:hypothetical protein